MKRWQFIISFTITVITVCSPVASLATPRLRNRAETVLNDASVRLGAGAGHTCRLSEDGTVRCWGFNFFGQLGDGTQSDQQTPVSVTGLTGAVAITGGDLYTCALQADGTARCWGTNSEGQLGVGSQSPFSLTPVSVSGLTNAVAISGGLHHTCALIADGTVECWGTNEEGQLGDGTFTTRSLPVIQKRVTGITNAVAISNGRTHSCALLATGRISCWGSNAFGQLGDGSRTNRPSPVEVVGIHNAIAVSALRFHTCALLVDGTVRCWGRNNFGQLGNGTSIDQLIPVPVVNLTNAVALATGIANHTCAVLADGSPRCWGADDFGQIGDGGSVFQAVPVSVAGVNNAVALALGGGHTCALLVTGVTSCWGANTNGQLGNNSMVDSLTPVNVVGGGGSVTGRAIAAGTSHTCAVRANSTVACWGANSSGQLGDNSTTTRLSPVTVVTVITNIATLVTNMTSAVAVAAGNAHTCALLASGRVRCWGDNSAGQLGDGSFTRRLSSVAVSGITTAVAITAGARHTCALLADGTARCWGTNDFGQLGNGSILSSTTPVAVSGLTDATALAAGGGHTCALVAGGEARCWGLNNSGQLGVGTTSFSNPTPLRVLDVASLVALATGDSHTCALVVDGTARCWGLNSNGQIGDGTTALRTLPNTVSGLTGAISLAAGNSHTCAARFDGTARCWGLNLNGQIGDGTTLQRLAPVAVTVQKFTITFALSSVTQIATGGDHTCARLANGAVDCWGANASGQIGDTTTNTRLRPGAVPSFTLNIDPQVVLEHNSRVATVTILAICEAGQRLHVEVTLTQGAVSGYGVGDEACTGGLGHFPVTVSAHGPSGFSEDSAVVQAVGHIRERGLEVDTQEWTRQAAITTAP
jgi:alpha-tubulin suppressor-like RCC1 family protein